MRSVISITGRSTNCYISDTHSLHKLIDVAKSEQSLYTLNKNYVSKPVFLLFCQFHIDHCAFLFFQRPFSMFTSIVIVQTNEIRRITLINFIRSVFFFTERRISFNIRKITYIYINVYVYPLNIH